MNAHTHDRRSFLRGTGRTVLACGCAVGGLALPLASAHAAQTCTAQTAASQKALSPQDALTYLKEGNARFAAGKPMVCNPTPQVAATATGQHPFAAVVSCIDSRAPANLIFDQSIGDVFEPRIAGNFVNDDMIGSLEFACAAAGAKVLMVVGHTECGAVKGACDDVVLGNLTQTLANIKPAVAAVQGFDSDRTSANAAFVQAVAEKNVELTLARIRQRSSILAGLEKKGDLIITGAMYDVGTGKVAFAA
ncbi:carbonic anhydrase family protein [Marinibaculum pumilum]|uniref:Carbonic anhydrase family protein n=1 Tax=Marinibaculum pumilum TaxID=1766165 RepID=A0ABV7KU28_9PROT